MLKKLSIQGKFFWIGITIVLIATVVGLVSILLSNKTTEVKAQNPNIVAIVNGKDILKKEYNNRIYANEFSGTPENPRKTTSDEKKMFLDMTVEDEILLLEAPKNGINITDAAVNDEIKKRELPTEQYSAIENELIKKYVKIDLIKKQIEEKVVSYKSGQYLLFRFDKYYQHEGLDYQGEGDQALITKQKNYAKSLADKVSADLASKKITFAQAIETVKTDSQISAAAFKPVTPNIYGTFDKYEYTENINYFNDSLYKGFREAVADLGKGEASKPFVLQANSTNGFQDIAYAITLVEDGKSGDSSSYQDWYNKKLKEYKVNVFYKNVGLSIDNVNYAKNLFVQTAYAYADGTVDCEKAYAGTEFVNIVAVAYYENRSGSLVRFGGNNMTIGVEEDTSDSPYDQRELKEYVTGCGVINTHNNDFTKRAKDNNFSNDAGRGYMVLNEQYRSEGTNYRSALINCSFTGMASIYMRRSDPYIPETVNDTSGSWEFINNNTTDAKWYDSSFEDSAGNFFIKLDLGTSGSWANGTQVTKRATYKPVWKKRILTKIFLDGTNVTYNSSVPGNITSSPAGINCGGAGSDCYEAFDSSTTPTLTATNSNATRYNWVQWKYGTGYDNQSPSRTNDATSMNFNMTVNDWTVEAHFVTRPQPCVINSFTSDKTGGLAPLTVTFSGSASNATTTSIDYNINTVDADGTTPGSYTYAANGTYTARYSCTGPGGNASRDITIDVSSDPDPTINFIAPGPNAVLPTGVIGGQYSVPFEAEITDPVDTDQVTFIIGYWTKINADCSQAGGQTIYWMPTNTWEYRYHKESWTQLLTAGTYCWTVAGYDVKLYNARNPKFPTPENNPYTGPYRSFTVEDPPPPPPPPPHCDLDSVVPSDGTLPARASYTGTNASSWTFWVEDAEGVMVNGSLETIPGTGTITYTFKYPGTGKAKIGIEPCPDVPLKSTGSSNPGEVRPTH